MVSSGDGKKILREALQQSGMRQMDIAEKFGLTTPTVSANMRRDRMSMDVFVSYLEAMGFSVFVGKMDGEVFEPMWKVDKSEI